MNEKRKSTAAGLPPLPPRNLYAAADPASNSRAKDVLAAKATRRARASKALSEATVATGTTQRPKGKRGRPVKPK